MKTRYSKRLKNETPEYGIFSKECLICLDNKHTDCFNFNPNCKHNICIICLHKWIKISDKCPTCKKSLIKDDLNYNNSLQFYIHLPFNSHSHSNNSPYIISFFKLFIWFIYIFLKFIRFIIIFRFTDFTDEDDNDNNIENALIISMEEYTNEIYGQAL